MEGERGRGEVQASTSWEPFYATPARFLVVFRERDVDTRWIRAVLHHRREWGWGDDVSFSRATAAARVHRRLCGRTQLGPFPSIFPINFGVGTAGPSSALQGEVSDLPRGLLRVASVAPSDATR